MHSRAVRRTLVALLLTAGIIAAVLTWDYERAIQALEQDFHAREAAVGRLMPSIAGVAAVQLATVSAGARDERSFTHVSELVDRIATDATALRPGDPAAAGAVELEAFRTALDSLTAVDEEARRALAAGDLYSAADRLIGPARTHVAELDQRLRAFRQAELDAFTAARRDLVRRSSMTIAGVAAAWAIGLLVLARVPSSAATTDAAPGRLVTPAAEPPVIEEGPPKVNIALTPSVDLAATAELCTAIARVADSTALPAILERAASIIEARGLIIWIGAGEELLPATAFGYDDGVVRRLRPIRRDDDNATAAAWREGEVRVVPGSRATHGAIVAPMFDTTGCLGVVAAEVRSGREHEPAVRATASIIASQLAMVLAAWPGSGSAGTASRNTLPPTSSDRKAAAS